MPDLSEFADADELDNRYIGKCVIYVEGIDDQKVWNLVAGSDFADRLEFKIPRAEGTGSQIVLNRVHQERENNPKVFGLVDGEVAAQFGAVESLINCSDVWFELQKTGCAGILFLSNHELENVLVGHSNLSEFVEYNLKPRMLGTRNRRDIEREISKQVRRFYVAALIKYTWGHMYSVESTAGIGNVDHFRSDNSTIEEIRFAKQNIEKEFLRNAKEFRREFVLIGRQLKKHMDSVERDGGSINAELVRLADGKGLMIKLRQQFQFTNANIGLLAHRVCQSDFAAKFREKLLDFANAHSGDSQ